MGVRDQLKKQRAKFDLYLKAKGNGIKDIVIDEIPTDKEIFLDSESSWQKLNIPEEEGIDVSACYFWGAEGEEMSSHFHKKEGEIMKVINREGEFEYISGDGRRGIVRYGETVYFPPGVAHWVKWIKTTVSIIIWSPSFEKGWIAGIQT